MSRSLFSKCKKIINKLLVKNADAFYINLFNIKEHLITGIVSLSIAYLISKQFYHFDVVFLEEITPISENELT